MGQSRVCHVSDDYNVYFRHPVDDRSAKRSNAGGKIIRQTIPFELSHVLVVRIAGLLCNTLGESYGVQRTYRQSSDR